MASAMAGPRDTGFDRTERGGVGIRVLWIAATLVMVALAIFWFLDKGQKNQEVLDRKAVEISEYGLLMALQRLKDSPSWCDALQKTEYESGWFTVAVKRQASNDTAFLVVEAVGHAGPVARKQGCVLRLEKNGNDSVWVRQSIK
jgi:hypothetical protein